MSRFFSNDSDSDSSDESSENEEENQSKALAPKEAEQFMYDSSDEEEEKRVVRTEKDKHWESFETTIGHIKNHLKINDWVAINNDFDLLQKKINKAKNVIRKHGIPKFYIKCILSIEESQKTQDTKKKSGGKKMSSSNAKGVNTMRQKLRKHNKAYEAQIAAYNKAPLVSEDEEEEEESEASEEEEEPTPVRKAKKAESSDDDDESDDDDDESDDDDDESDDDEDDSKEWDSDDSEDEGQQGAGDDFDIGLMADGGNPYSRDFWTKKAEVDDSVQKKQAIVEFVKRVKLSYKGWEDDLEDAKEDARTAPEYVDKSLRKMERKQKDLDDEKKQKQEVKAVTSKPKSAEEKVYTPEVISKKLKELVSMRGKRGTNRQQVVTDLKLLATKATTPVVMLKVKTTLTAALFDSTLNTVKYMPRATWIDLHKTLIDILDVLKKNPLVRLSEDDEVKDAFEEDDEDSMTMESLMEEEEARTKRLEEKAKRLEEERKQQEEAGEVVIQYVHGNLYAVVQRVVAEFHTSLQHIDPHTPEYVVRLRDEKATVELVARTQAYYKQTEKPALERKVALVRLEMVYYHYIPALDEQSEAKEEKSSARKVGKSRFGCFPAPILTKGKASETHELANFLYSSPDSREKMRALLCHVYHLALHNRCGDARNLLLMSHAQDTINDADIRTRILFNRTMAQMGLCYFRLGEVGKALNCLQELYQSNRFKELLAQGISSTRYGQERDVEKEKLERRRQYPYHMHINLDLLESVHLLSAMFLEVPNLAAFGAEFFTLRRNKKKVISKTFRRLLEHHSSKAFNGPPENTRDSVMAATKAMQQGDWKDAMVNIDRLKMWKLLPNSDVVKGMIRNQVKQVTLKTYLLSYGPQYTSISLAKLSEMFEMSDKDVYKLVSKMIFNDQLQGSWHQPSQCVVMQSEKSTQLQTVCTAYADKASQFLEQNEKLLEQKFGFYTNKQSNNDKSWHNKGGNQGGDKKWDNNNGGGDFNNSYRNSGNAFGNFRNRGANNNNRDRR